MPNSPLEQKKKLTNYHVTWLLPKDYNSLENSNKSQQTSETETEII